MRRFFHGYGTQVVARTCGMLQWILMLQMVLVSLESPQGEGVLGLGSMTFGL